MLFCNYSFYITGIPSQLFNLINAKSFFFLLTKSLKWVEHGLNFGNNWQLGKFNFF